MNKIKTIIQKAIEGGWKGEVNYFVADQEHGLYVEKDNIRVRDMSIESTFLWWEGFLEGRCVSIYELVFGDSKFIEALDETRRPARRGKTWTPIALNMKELINKTPQQNNRTICMSWLK